MDNTNGVAASPMTHIGPAVSLQENLTKDEWRKKYWFDTYTTVTVKNPKDTDYNFMVEGRHYVVPAKQVERLVGMLANVYLDQMSKILAQEDGNLAFMADPNLSRIYYDLLITGVEDMRPKADQTPFYLRNVPAAALAAQPPQERAPWDSTMGERATDVAPAASEPMPQTPNAAFASVGTAAAAAPAAPAKEETKQFDYNGAVYKMVVSSTGQRMHYRDSKLISAADYNKAASML